METVTLSESGVGVASIKAAGTMRLGGVILYPTDTLYGLGADAFSDVAVDKIYAIKDRDSRKPIHCICADIVMIEEYSELNDAARKLAQKFLPGALTLVLKKRSGANSGIGREMDTIGVRIPDNSFCIETARSLGRPFTATSANRANSSPEFSLEKILEQLGGSIGQLGLVIDAGALSLRPPSTVVNLVSGHPVILREGAISREEIAKAVE